MNIGEYLWKPCFFLPIVFVMSCTSDVAEDPVTWADTDITFHNEMMACTAGTDFSQDSVNAMMSEYDSLLSSEDLVGAWGYIPASAENRFDNGWWELSWTSKEAANAGWSEWNSNPDAQAWSEKHANVMGSVMLKEDHHGLLFGHMIPMHLVSLKKSLVRLCK